MWLVYEITIVFTFVIVKKINFLWYIEIIYEIQILVFILKALSFISEKILEI